MGNNNKVVNNNNKVVTKNNKVVNNNNKVDSNNHNNNNKVVNNNNDKITELAAEINNNLVDLNKTANKETINNDKPVTPRNQKLIRGFTLGYQVSTGEMIKSTIKVLLQ